MVAYMLLRLVHRFTETEDTTTTKNAFCPLSLCHASEESPVKQKLALPLFYTKFNVANRAFPCGPRMLILVLVIHRRTIMEQGIYILIKLINLLTVNDHQ